MITAIIVWGSLIFAVVLCIIYFANPSWRKKIEQPKYQFHQQVLNFDKNTTQAQQRSGS